MPGYREYSEAPSSGGSDERPRATLPKLEVDECLHYTLTLDPDVTLLGLSFPNEQDAAFAAAESFRPLTPEQLENIRGRARIAMEQKGAAWWNPACSQREGRSVPARWTLSEVKRILDDMVRWSPAWAMLGVVLAACGFRAESTSDGSAGAGGETRAQEGSGDHSASDEETPDAPAEDTAEPSGAGGASSDDTPSEGGSAPTDDRPSEGGAAGSGATPTVSIGASQCGDGAAWAFELVDEGLGDHLDAALAVDAGGAVFLAYTDVRGAYLASNAGGSWLVETLDEVDGYHTGASLALDAEGAPRVAYARQKDAVIYARRGSDGGFMLETVEAGAGGYSTALALDASGAPHLTYYTQGRHAAFRYAVRTPTSWSITTLDADAFDRDSAIAIDDAGVVHISYYALSLQYAHNAGGNGFSSLESAGGLDSAMVLAESPIIAHCETGLGVLVGSPETGFEALGYGVETSLARSADGTLHLTYTISEDEVVYATNASGSFETELVTAAASPWSNTALALAPDGTPYVAVSTYAGELYLGRRCQD